MGVKVPLPGDVAAPGRCATESRTRGPPPGLGNPWGGAAESVLPPSPALGTLATGHQPVCSPCFGILQQQGLGTSSSAGTSHPTSPAESPCPPMALIHPQPPHYGVRVQPQRQGGDFGRLSRWLCPQTDPPQPAGHPEPGRGWDRGRKGGGLRVEMVGEDGGCAALG